MEFANLSQKRNRVPYFLTTAALHSLKRYNDAIAAYEEGLEKFPNDEALKKGIEEVKRDKDGPPRGMGGMGGMGGGLFPPGANNPFGSQLVQKMLLNPKTRPYLNDKEFMAKIQRLQTDPNSLMEMLSDPRVMEVLGMSLGAGMGDDDEDEPPPGRAAETLRKQQAATPAPAPKPHCAVPSLGLIWPRLIGGKPLMLMAPQLVPQNAAGMPSAARSALLSQT